MTARHGRVEPAAKEVKKGQDLTLDGSGTTSIATGVAFFDHGVAGLATVESLTQPRKPGGRGDRTSRARRA